MFAEVMEALTGRRFQFEVVVMEGYWRRRMNGTDYPGLLERSGENVTCRLYFDLPPESIRVLDRFEDPLYQRKGVTVVSAGRGVVSAQVYLLPKARASLLSDDVWSEERFGKENLSSYLAMCADFLRSLKDSTGVDT